MGGENDGVIRDRRPVFADLSNAIWTVRPQGDGHEELVEVFVRDQPTTTTGGEA